MPMLLVLAFLFMAGAVFALGEVATYPARLKARSIRRARDYGRLRIPKNEAEVVRFRERVVAPAAQRLAAIPLKLRPKTNLESISTRLVAAGLASRLSVRGFLAVRGAALVAGVFAGVAAGAAGSIGM